MGVLAMPTSFILGVVVGSLMIQTISTYVIDEVVNDNEVLISGSQRQEESAFDQISKINKDDQKASGKTWLFEADIELTDEPEGRNSETSGIESSVMKRSLRRSQEYLWVDRVVPYEVTSQLAHWKEIIVSAMQEIAKVSCISFVERTTESNWIRFEENKSCYSSVGRNFWIEGGQTIGLSNGCLNSPGTIMHEVLHSLGFWHEQSRPDRDQNVEIMWENIAKGEENNFAKYNRQSANDLKSSYDYQSIMHYGKTSFSKNGKPTILALDDPQKSLGQRNGLSTEDIVQLNALYRCKDVGKVFTDWSEWSPCDDNCIKKKQRFCSNYDPIKCPEASTRGVHTETSSCPVEECHKPRAGHWGRWSWWGECTHACGKGTRERSRACDDPLPKYGGENCVGKNTEVMECTIKPCGVGKDDCLFDGQGMCFWQDSSSSSYNWKRIKGRTPSGRTGPEGDHSTMKSTNDGYYLYTESSAPAKTGMKAHLVSRVFSSEIEGKKHCLTFFYSMHGLGIGALRIFLVHPQTGVEQELWSKTGPQGEGWKEGEIDFSSSADYKIKFESERGPSFQGDMGLDDIFFTNGKCSDKSNGWEDKQTTTTTTTTPTPTTTTPTPTPPTTTPSQEPSFTHCGVAIRPVGCFTEIPSKPALPVGIVTDRSHINWKNYKETLEKLLCRCVTQGKASGMRYVGLQYYGECWGSRLRTAYSRYGDSRRCINTIYGQCIAKEYHDICVGEGNANYVYQIL